MAATLSCSFRRMSFVSICAQHSYRGKHVDFAGTAIPTESLSCKRSSISRLSVPKAACLSIFSQRRTVWLESCKKDHANKSWHVCATSSCFVRRCTCSRKTAVFSRPNLSFLVDRWTSWVVCEHIKFWLWLIECVLCWPNKLLLQYIKRTCSLLTLILYTL